MKPAKKLQEGKGAFELIEEAFHLLRLAPASTLASYYLGALPFVLALLFFWSDMSRSAFAAQRLAGGAFGLSLLFFWMKTWQAIFAQDLLARLGGEAAQPWSLPRLWRVGLIQASLQPPGLFLLLIAVSCVVPFGWTYAFYQNVTVLGDGSERALSRIFKRAWSQARLWPLQNHYLLLLLKLFGLFVFTNLLTGALAIPFLLNKFLGVETVFSQSTSAMLNTTFFAGLFGLTYLCLDPILKAVYVLRCFYGESLHTGRDLKAELKSLQSPRTTRAALALIFLLGMILGAKPASGSERKGGPATLPESPQPTPLSAPALDRSIDEVLRKREFTWRMPREKLQKAEASKGPVATMLESIMDTLEDWLKAVGRWVNDFVRWLGKYLRPRPITTNSTGGTGWVSTIYFLLWVVAIALVCALLFLLFRVWRNRHQLPIELAAEAIVPMPDVADENVGAGELPEDGWIKLARELLEKGELRLALRAFYLASLARLAASGLITIAKFKSNRDYERELRRRAHALPEVLNGFTDNVTVFDRVWYGLHEATPAMVTEFAGNVERIKPAQG